MTTTGSLAGAATHRMVNRILRHGAAQRTDTAMTTATSLAQNYIFVLGVANLVVAFNASERAWVNFKVFGLTAATLLFIGAQVAWLTRQSAAAQSA